MTTTKGSIGAEKEAGVIFNGLISFRKSEFSLSRRKRIEIDGEIWKDGFCTGHSGYKGRISIVIRKDQ